MISAKIKTRRLDRNKFNHAIYGEQRRTIRKNSTELVTAQIRAINRNRSHNLKKSTSWIWGNKSPDGARLKSSAKASNILSATVFSGDDDAFYAHFHNFGVKPQTRGKRISRKSGDRKSRRTTKGQRAYNYFLGPYRLRRRKFANRQRAALRKVVKQFRKHS